MSINSDDFNCDLNPKTIMRSPIGNIIKYTVPQGLFSEEKKFFSEKYEEYLKDHEDKDCVDSSTTNLSESVQEMSPSLLRLCLSILKYIEKLEKERIEDIRIIEDLKETSSYIFNSDTFPKFELDTESNETLSRVGQDLRVIKRYFESVKDVETSNDGEFQNFLEEIVTAFHSMQTHHSIICGLLGLEMDNSVVVIQEHLIYDEVNRKRFRRHYQLACVAVTYFNSLFSELDKVYFVPPE